MATSNDILMIGWEYPPHNSGGLGVACQGLTQALADQNAQIHFTLPFQLGSTISHMKVSSCVDPTWAVADENGHAIHGLPPFMAYAKDSAFGLSDVSKYKPLDAVELAALPQSSLEHKVDQYADLVAKTAYQNKKNIGVVHAHDWMSFPAAAKVKQATGKPFIAHVHSTEVDRIPNGFGSSYIRKTEYQGMMLADKVIAVSYYTKQLLINAYQIPASKIEVVHNGMLPATTVPDPGSHHFAHNRPVVAFMGRLTGQKGPMHFLWLAEQLTKRIPNLLFVVAGSGDMYHELLVQTAAKGLSTSVLFSGFVRDTQREKLLDRADVFVMPSLSEPFGLVALEAAERHTPVIVSKTSGVSEVLSSAVRVDFWDVDQMVDTIQKLLDDGDHHARVTNNQLNELQDITWNKAATRVQEIYRKVFIGK
jgi:glycosyltransferase involved in cell wall biosynthesis